jgi:hydrogenase maturation protease
MKLSILIAGVGNIFLGDDGFGVEVALALLKRGLPECVFTKDFGIRGFDLAYTLLDPWETVILVDALPRGDVPGTLYVVEPELAGLGNLGSPEMAMNPHGMDPVRVLNLAASMGPISAQVFIVGCEPKDFGDELEGRMGLSAPVQAVVEEACNMVEELVERILIGNGAEGRMRSAELQKMER